MPGQDEFLYDVCSTLSSLEPEESILSPPSNIEATPPLGRYFPSCPSNGYVLERDNRYTRGFVYAAPYNVSLSAMNEHKDRLINIAMPPISMSPVDGKIAIPSMIQMVPGIPFVFRFNGDPGRTHTVACLQTLESLKHYPDFEEILNCSVRLAKLSWGCPATSSSPEIRPIYELEGLKTNDRSAGRRDLQHDAFDGSYSLGNTVMKGEGLGTVLPAVQADSTRAVAQINATLSVLHSLRRLVLPKCLSKFEHDILDFHLDYNNVFSFGGLEPNGSSVQLNVSSIGKVLDRAIGDYQGFWHVDISDDPQMFTLFILLFRLAPGMRSST